MADSRIRSHCLGVILLAIFTALKLKHGAGEMVLFAILPVRLQYPDLMLQHLIEFDRHLFHIINHDLTNPFFDWIMPLLRNAKFWIPLYVFIIGFCLYKYKKQGAILILLLALSAGIADFTSVHLIKNTVQRLRPCHDPVVSPTVISRAPCGSGYSFPSTHATDHFAMGAFLTLVFFRKWRWIWAWAFLWAASISFAQVYVGVHFPIDITVGMLYGILIGSLMGLLFKKLQPGF